MLVVERASVWVYGKSVERLSVKILLLASAPNLAVLKPPHLLVLLVRLFHFLLQPLDSRGVLVGNETSL